MEKQIYTIAVGRGQGNAKYVTVMCASQEVETIALAIYNYSQSMSEMPIACAYVKGEHFDWHNHSMVVLADCM